jgi:hypothetical protein
MYVESLPKPSLSGFAGHNRGPPADGFAARSGAASFSNVGALGRRSRAGVPLPFQGTPDAAARVDRTSVLFARSTAQGLVKREDCPVKMVAALAAVSVLALGGCASAQRAEEHAQDMAASQCPEGQEFVQTGGTAASNGAVAAATAKGHCAGPGDPDYVPPPPNP